MGRVNDDKWLDEALNKAIHSDDTRPDFEQWKAKHPEAVQKLTAQAPPSAQHLPVIRRMTMNVTLVKLAAAAVIAIAAVFGITQLTKTSSESQTIVGPVTYTLPDDSTVKLAAGASIRTFAGAGQRGFEHLAGIIDVTVTKGKGEFLVTTPYGEVKALGTQFKMEMVDGTAQNTKEKVQLLSVEVEEGKVQVSNAKGSSVLGASQKLVMSADQSPYDFSQDTRLPARLRERIQSMSVALEAGDTKAWIANYNTNYMFKLIKGQEKYDAQRFGGDEADLERLRKGFGDIAGPQDLVQRFVASGGLNGAGRIYVQRVVVTADEKHAQARCIRRTGEHSMVITNPQWHFFDNDWWQVDD
jgi:hypothetical protein